MGLLLDAPFVIGNLSPILSVKNTNRPLSLCSVTTALFTFEIKIKCRMECTPPCVCAIFPFERSQGLIPAIVAYFHQNSIMNMLFADMILLKAADCPDERNSDCSNMLGSFSNIFVYLVGILQAIQGYIFLNFPNPLLHFSTQWASMPFSYSKAFYLVT